MNQFWNNWATARKKGGDLFIVIAMVGIFIQTLLLMNQDHQLLRTETVISTITHVQKFTRTYTKYGQKISIDTYKCRIELPDGQEIEIRTVESPIPQVGGKIPIVIQYYDDGHKYYGYNKMEWYLH